IKSFTIDSDGGLTGFPVGKEVKVIDVKNDKLLVEDKNKKQNWQSKDFFDGKKPVAKLVAKPVNTAREPVISNLLFEGVCIRSDFENGTISVGCKILITDYSGVAITNPNNETIIMGSTYDSGREDLIGINWKELPNCQSLIKIDPRTGIGELIIGGVPGSGKVPKGAIFRMSPK
ncbi:MAG: hypothetical protein NTZ94_13590, partial [Verrucomicrobia bacterium]|nr:hypothetical protein [Verrucomicrobiota bacterium]